MYSNFNKLSENCQEAIEDVYALRDQYWSEEQHAHHPHGLFLILIGFIIAIGIIKRHRLRAARRERDLALYNALQANPELKAQVEAASGIVIEAPRAEGSCCFFFLRVVVAIAVGFFIWVTSVFITM